MTPDALQIYETRLGCLMDGRAGEPTPLEMKLASDEAAAYQAQLDAVTVKCRGCGATVLIPADSLFIRSAIANGVQSCDQCPATLFDERRTRQDNPNPARREDGLIEARKPYAD